jgi:SAM-dependent methyltransferase
MHTEKDLYNNAYSRFTPDYIQVNNISKINDFLKENSESLEDFFDKYCNQFDLEHKVRQSSCLELGCGIGSLSYFLKNKFYNYTGVDNSGLAISTAKEIAILKKESLDLRLFDVCSGESLDEKFDFIIDSHLYHCLTTKEERQSYLEFIKNHLSTDGIFLLETMAFQPKLQVPVGYHFDSKYVLSKDFKGCIIPIRSIFPSVMIEEEFANAGMKINYLYFHNELSFNVFDDYINYSIDYLPKTIRLSVSLGV